MSGDQLNSISIFTKSAEDQQSDGFLHFLHLIRWKPRVEGTKMKVPRNKVEVDIVGGIGKTIALLLLESWGNKWM